MTFAATALTSDEGQQVLTEASGIFGHTSAVPHSRTAEAIDASSAHSAHPATCA